MSVIRVSINLENHLDKVKEFVRENKKEFEMIGYCDCEEFDNSIYEDEIREKATATFLEDLYYNCLNIKNEELRNEFCYFVKHKQNKDAFRDLVNLINKFVN
jgi:hypothetical protein